MANRNFSIDELLALKSRGEIRGQLAASRLPLTQPDAQRLAARLAELEPAERPLRVGIVHTYTSELLEPWMGFAAALQGLTLQTYHAPYGATVQEAHAESGLVAFQPDLTLLMLQREDLHPDLALPLTRFDAKQLGQLREDVVARLVGLVSRFRALKTGQIVLTLLPSMNAPGLGIFDAQAERSMANWWSGVKAEIGQRFRETLESSLFLDLDDVLLQLGSTGFFDRRLWYSARYPFSTAAARELSRRITALGAVIKFPRAKVIVLDADNTLWGGVIGEDGMDGIALGPDYPGSAYVDFQRRILDFQQRGFILAMCSKNNPADVDQVLKDHPHQLLRDGHFAARRVNWLPKPDNLVSLAEELNLGLDSFVFVDDSDHECAAVRQRLPQVEVVQVPGRAIDVPNCLDQVARLEVLTLTAEDLVKTEMYAQERRRRELKDQAGKSGSGLGDYLKSLDMRMLVSVDNARHLARLSQLTQKTNQFNLTTRRYDERRMQEFIAAEDWIVADFAVADVFGHSGIVGLAIFRFPDPAVAELDTFLMSCRVIGREAEAAFLHWMMRTLVRRGVREVLADFIPTAKNDLARSFLSDQGFAQRADGRYCRMLDTAPPHPEDAFPIVIAEET